MSKFRKVLLSLFFVFICALGFMLNINAEEEVKEEYKIEVKAETGNAGSSLYMTLEGFDKEQAVTNDTEYFVKFVNEDDEKPVLSGNPYDSPEGVKRDINSYIRVNVYKNDETNTYHSSISMDDDWYMLKGYTTAYIIKCTPSNTCEVVDNPVTVQKPALPILSQRYHNYLQHNEEDGTTTLDIFQYFPYIGEMGSHEINVEIGLITDESLLKKLAKNESSSLEELMEYAKNNSGEVFTVKDENDTDIEIDDFEIIDGSYYYMYTYYTNTDGLYRNLDDIAVAMGENNWLVNDVEWNFDESIWDLFVEKFKNTELVKMYDDTDAVLKIESTDNTLTVTLTIEEETYVTKFNYEDGILKYDSESKEDELILVDNLWQMNAINALSDLKGYNVDKVSNWLIENEDKVLTIENDGIEFKSKDYSYTGEENGVTTSIDGKILTSFELDIENGLKSYNEEKISDYRLISGENQKYKVNESKELKFQIDAEYSLFENVYLNGKLLDKSNYTVSEGSTIVILKNTYLNKLNNGTHTLRINFKDGKYAETKFTIENNVENPNTGINSKTTIFIIIGLICVATYLIVRKQSKFPKHN